MTQFRVLIIDDDRLMRNSLVDLMDAAGWVTKLAGPQKPIAGSPSFSQTSFCLMCGCPKCPGWICSAD